MSTKYHGTACKTCRRRGRKCSKELPSCRSCLDKGIDCEGYVLRWAGMASRGKLAGKMAMTDPMTISTRPLKRICDESQPHSIDLAIEEHLAPSISSVNMPSPDPGHASPLDCLVSSGWSPSIFNQATLVDVDLDIDFGTGDTGIEQFDQVLEELTYGSSTMDLPMTLNNALDPYNIPMELKFILNYHLLEVAPKLCVDNSTIRNPYTQFILQLAVEKPPLLYACAALAASHFNVRLSDPSFKVDCLRFRGKSMRRLQEQLWSENNAKDDGNITTVLMLTLTDMCLGGYSNFDAHFGAAKRLIDIRGANRTQDTFVEQYIAWLDIMCATNNRRKPLFTSKDVAALTGPSREWSHDVFPCPPDQFAVVSEITELYKLQQDPPSLTPEILAKVDECKAKILTLPMHTERGTGWLHLTEAFRHAIALYMIRLFHLKADEDEIAWLTQSVFYHAKLTTPSTGWTDHLLWPLFHAGLEFRDERRQQWLRDRSQVMQRSGGFRNVETSMKILEDVWSSGTNPDYADLLFVQSLGTMVNV